MAKPLARRRERISRRDVAGDETAADVGIGKHRGALLEPEEATMGPENFLLPQYDSAMANAPSDEFFERGWMSFFMPPSMASAMPVLGTTGLPLAAQAWPGGALMLR
jgi:hypothetical protein